MNAVESWRELRPAWFISCCDEVKSGEFNGWNHIAAEAFEEVEALLRLHPHFPLRLTHIKEKLGGLRIYFVRDQSGSSVDSAIQAIFGRLREQSERTCQICGEAGSLGTSRRCRLEVRCDACQPETWRPAVFLDFPA